MKVRMRGVVAAAVSTVVAVVAIAAFGDWLIGLRGVSVVGTVVDLSMGFAALVIAMAGLRYLDRELGYNTTERINEMPDMPFAVYLAGRLLAVGLLLGLALS